MKTFEKKPKMTTHPVRRGRIQVLPSFDPAAQIQRAQIRQVLRFPQVQAKLTIGQPNDKYEQEADRVADEVMHVPEPRLQRQVEPKEEVETLQAKPLAEQLTPLVQRQVEPEEEKFLQPRLETYADYPIQRQAEEEEKEEVVQAKRRTGHCPEITPELESRIQSLRGGGQPLLESERAFFEFSSGIDFGRVRIHTDARANELATVLNAHAFTKGQEIFFGAGQYSSGTARGRRLLAHELTHVMQQAAGSVRKGKIGAPNDRLEREADRSGEQLQEDSGSFGIEMSGVVPEIQKADLYLYDPYDILTEAGGCEDWDYLVGRCEQTVPGGTRVGVACVDDVIAWLDLFAKAGEKFQSIEFYTHGAPGYVGLENGGISVQDIDRFKGRNAVLEEGARVLFIGCNVGEGFVGETFLLEMGKQFLGTKGGFVGATTSSNRPAPFTREVHMPIWGKLRIVQVDKQGNALLIRGIQYPLDEQICRQRKRWRQLWTVFILKARARGMYTPESYLGRAEQWLLAAKGILWRGGVTRVDVAKGIDYLRWADDLLGEVRIKELP